MFEEEIIEPNPIYKILIMVLPVGVVLGTIIFMYMYFYLERQEDKKQSIIVSREMKVTELDLLVEKFSDRIGLRDLDTEQGRNGLLRAGSMIRGGLGPQNLGLKVTQGEGKAAHGLLWRSLSVDIKGDTFPEEVVVAAVSYSGEGEISDANTVSTMVMLVNSMARKKSGKTIRFVFLPLRNSGFSSFKKQALEVIGSDEKLAGYIALDTMEGMPDLLGQGWVDLETKSAVEIGVTQEIKRGEVKSFSLTHSVYSADAWQGNRGGRLASTLRLAQELKQLLRGMAD